MAKRRRKTVLPMMLLWNKRDQVRFIEAVERLNGLVNDLSVLVDTKKRRSAAAFKANETRRQNGTEANGGVQ